MVLSEEAQKGFEWKSKDREKKWLTAYMNSPRASCPVCWKWRLEMERIGMSFTLWKPQVTGSFFP
jgi:hypothetical protein